jgi:hypothetical protein
MRIRNLVPALLIAVPSIGVAQVARSTQATFDQMQANVAKITVQGEKERWQANADMWQVKLAHMDKLAKPELDKITASLNAMKMNVAKIAIAAEKERWQANVDLWQASLAPKVAKADLDKMNAALSTIKANVAKITVPAEKERWEANRDLWQAVLDKLPKG